MQLLDRSELAQRVGINEIAESMMAFNTNYKDTGLFGVYAVAKVRVTESHPTIRHNFSIIRGAHIICASWSSLHSNCRMTAQRRFCHSISCLFGKLRIVNGFIMTVRPSFG